MRRVFWNLYAWPITLLLVSVSVLTLVSRFNTLSLLDGAITLPGLVALHCHIWDTRFLPGKFWRAYAFIFTLWDLLFNLVLEPWHSGERFKPVTLVVPIFLLPLYIGIFRYAFRKWDQRGLPNEALQAAAAPPRC